MKEFDQYTDEELMLKVQNDDVAAFNVLYSRFAPLLYGYLKKTTASYQDVDELFQQTVLKLHRYKDTFNIKYAFKPWLFTICKNIKKDFYKKEKTFSLYKDQFLKELNFELSILENELGQIQDYRDFHKLGEQEQRVMQLRFNEELDYQEMATNLNATPASLRKTVSRSIEKLRLWAKVTS